MLPLFVALAFLYTCPQHNKTKIFAGKNYILSQCIQPSGLSIVDTQRFAKCLMSFTFFFFSGTTALQLWPWDGILCRLATSLLPDPTSFSTAFSTPSLPWKFKETTLLPDQNMCQSEILPGIKCLSQKQERTALRNTFFGPNNMQVEYPG